MLIQNRNSHKEAPSPAQTILIERITSKLPRLSLPELQKVYADISAILDREKKRY